MLRTDEGVWYSASDVLNWIGCAHRSALDARAMDDETLREWLRAHRNTAELINPDVEDAEAYETPAQIRGDLHERAMLAQLEAEGLEIVRIARPENLTSAAIRVSAEATLQAMRDGAQVIFQAALLNAPWYGFADFLMRVDGVPSRLGNYSYEVRDTKLARHATVNALVQMAHYGAIVEQWQGTPPPALQVWIGTGELIPWSYTDAAPYLQEARRRFLAAVPSAATTPEPCHACSMCRWSEYCDDVWGPDDLKHVHRLTRRQRALLQSQGISTIADLAAAGSKPQGMAQATFERLRLQATAQASANGFTLIRPQSRTQGLMAVPAPDPGDLYFDLEGDPFAGIPTLDYLWAYCDARGNYEFRWAHDVDAERAAFQWFVDVLEVKDAVGGDWHVYHYNSYEITSLRRIAEAWPDASAHMLDRVTHLIERRFIDLYRIVENSLRTQHGTTSLKLVEHLAGYDRTIDAAAVAKADDSILEYEKYVLSRDETEKAEILQGIRDYNTHDVRATLAVHRWLHGLTEQLSEQDVVDDQAEEYQRSDKMLDRIARTSALRDALLSAAAIGELASGLSPHGARLLADMLDWHRTESAVAYLDALRLQAWAREEAHPDQNFEMVEELVNLGLDAPRDTSTHIQAGTEHESCLLDVELISVGAPSPQKRLHSFRCRPGSWKIRKGDAVVEVLPLDADRKPRSFTVVDIDPAAGTFAFDVKEAKADVIGYSLKNSFGDEGVWESLMRLGDAAVGNIPADAHQLGLSMLDALPPLPPSEMLAHAEQTAGDRARSIAQAMDGGLLPVQGPPGTGKTYTGARLIGDALAAKPDALVVVTAVSHRVIDNLMRATAEYLREETSLTVAMARAVDKERFDASYGAEQTANNEMIDWAANHQGERRVIGATKFGFSRAEWAGMADLLVIDEAGQFTLADSLAVAQVAKQAVALGDPQQLSSPIKAAHDEAVRVSLLEHIARGEAVLTPERGVFLDESYRMHPALCTIVGELAYEGELRSSERAAKRNIGGMELDLGFYTEPVQPGLTWIPVAGGQDAEVAAAVQVVEAMVGQALVTDGNGVTAPLRAEELLVVAPHNATVNRLRTALPDAVRVGTVDRFQGQEGDVVVFVMGRLAEKASDVPFLYALNRINVAISRARLTAIVVAHPDAVFPPVGTPEHLMLASRFIRALTSAL